MTQNTAVSNKGRDAGTNDRGLHFGNSEEAKPLAGGRDESSVSAVGAQEKSGSYTDFAKAKLTNLFGSTPQESNSENRRDNGGNDDDDSESNLDKKVPDTEQAPLSHAPPAARSSQVITSKDYRNNDDDFKLSDGTSTQERRQEHNEDGFFQSAKNGLMRMFGRGGTVSDEDATKYGQDVQNNDQVQTSDDKREQEEEERVDNNDEEVTDQKYVSKPRHLDSRGVVVDEADRPSMRKRIANAFGKTETGEDLLDEYSSEATAVGHTREGIAPSKQQWRRSNIADAGLQPERRSQPSYATAQGGLMEPPKRTAAEFFGKVQRNPDQQQEGQAARASQNMNAAADDDQDQNDTVARNQDPNDQQGERTTADQTGYGEQIKGKLNEWLGLDEGKEKTEVVTYSGPSRTDIGLKK